MSKWCSSSFATPPTATLDSSFTGAGTFKNIPHITLIILDGTGQVSVTGPWAGNTAGFVATIRFGRHLLDSSFPSHGS